MLASKVSHKSKSSSNCVRKWWWLYCLYQPSARNLCREHIFSCDGTSKDFIFCPLPIWAFLFLILAKNLGPCMTMLNKKVVSKQMCRKKSKSSIYVRATLRIYQSSSFVEFAIICNPLLYWLQSISPFLCPAWCCEPVFDISDKKDWKS